MRFNSDITLRTTQTLPQRHYSVTHYQNTHTITIPTIHTPTILQKAPHIHREQNPHIHTPIHYKTIQTVQF